MLFKDVLTLLLVGSATAFATGLGAVPILALKRDTEAIRVFLSGVTAGIMSTAAVIGLLLPAIDLGKPGEVVFGLAAGGMFVIAVRRLLSRRDSGSSVQAIMSRRSLLVFAVLFVHSVPEGFALGTAYESEIGGLALFVFLAIGLQNIPEGTSVAIPMKQAGFGPSRQFWAAVLTSSPQPACAIIAFLLVHEFPGFLATSFAFASGAMLVLVAVELVPSTYKTGSWKYAAAGTALGTSVIFALSATIGV